jgi:hypothetical protein
MFETRNVTAEILPTVIAMLGEFTPSLTVRLTRATAKEETFLSAKTTNLPTPVVAEGNAGTAHRWSFLREQFFLQGVA